LQSRVLFAPFGSGGECKMWLLLLIHSTYPIMP
jgi:hypothetical protein